MNLITWYKTLLGENGLEIREWDSIFFSSKASYPKFLYLKVSSKRPLTSSWNFFVIMFTEYYEFFDGIWENYFCHNRNDKIRSLYRSIICCLPVYHQPYHLLSEKQEAILCITKHARMHDTSFLLSTFSLMVQVSNKNKTQCLQVKASQVHPQFNLKLSV